MFPLPLGVALSAAVPIELCPYLLFSGFRARVNISFARVTFIYVPLTHLFFCSPRGGVSFFASLVVYCVG